MFKCIIVFLFVVLAIHVKYTTSKNSTVTHCTTFRRANGRLECIGLQTFDNGDKEEEQFIESLVDSVVQGPLGKLEKEFNNVEAQFNALKSMVSSTTPSSRKKREETETDSVW